VEWQQQSGSRRSQRGVSVSHHQRQRVYGHQEDDAAEVVTIRKSRLDSWQDLATARIFPTAAEFDSVHGEGAWVGYLEWAEDGIIKRETEIREYLPELSTR